MHLVGTSTLEYELIISAPVVLLPLPNRWSTGRKVSVITGWFCIISECPLTCYTLARNEFLGSPRHMNGRWHCAIMSMWRGYSQKRVILHRPVQLTWGLRQRRHVSRRVGSHLVFWVADNLGFSEGFLILLCLSNQIVQYDIKTGHCLCLRRLCL